jgi:hypothetical protein
MITGSLFGTPDDKGKLGGGLLSSLLGGLFGGGAKAGGFTGGWASMANDLTGKQSGGGIGGFLSSIFGSLFGGGKASGGMVRGDRFYKTGERGVELFSPGTDGMITPNNKIGGKKGNQRFIFVDSEREAERHSMSDDDAFILRFQRNRHILMPHM